jgi:hypothetical protein
VARSSIRFAAGTGAVVGFLLVGGTAMPVVAADPGHSRGGDNHSGRGGNDLHRGRDGDNRRDGRDGDRDGRGVDRDDRDDGRDGQAGNGRHGQGKGDRDDDWGRGDSGQSSERSTSRAGESSRISDDSSSEVVTSNSSAARAPALTTSPNARVATIEAVPAVPTAPDPTAPDPADSDRGGGSDGAAATAGDIRAVASPPVRVGDGRSPGILTNSRETTPSRAGAGPTYVPSPAAAPPPEPAPAPPLPSEPEPMLRTVETLWAVAEPTRPDGTVWGIAGLVLAPIAGAWLGYRQARASKAAGQLIKH